jgi:23S rRNA-/tRNA-specific pseudouridylate synthase
MNTIFSPSFSDRLDIVISIDQSLSIAFTHYLINKRLVLINGRYCRKKSVLVTPDDTITLMHKHRNLDPAVLSEAPDIQIPIIFQHPDYLVIHKPKGVLTHPTTIKNTTFPSVTGFLYHYTKKYLPECHHFVRASIVHRLDRDTD